MVGAFRGVDNEEGRRGLGVLPSRSRPLKNSRRVRVKRRHGILASHRIALVGGGK
jgi:hypothetical protein